MILPQRNNFLGGESNFSFFVNLKYCNHCNLPVTPFWTHLSGQHPWDTASVCRTSDILVIFPPIILISAVVLLIFNQLVLCSLYSNGWSSKHICKWTYRIGCLIRFLYWRVTFQREGRLHLQCFAPSRAAEKKILLVHSVSVRGISIYIWSIVSNRTFWYNFSCFLESLSEY